MAATNGYFHIDLSIMYSINRLVVWSVKCQIYKMKPSNVFFFTTQRYSVHRHKGGKTPEYIHI